MIFFTARSSQAVALAAEDNLPYSENVAYDTASNTKRMSAQAKVTCTENTAYSTVRGPRDDSVKSHLPAAMLHMTKWHWNNIYEFEQILCVYNVQKAQYM